MTWIGTVFESLKMSWAGDVVVVGKLFWTLWSMEREAVEACDWVCLASGGLPSKDTQL